MLPSKLPPENEIRDGCRSSIQTYFRLPGLEFTPTANFRRPRGRMSHQLGRVRWLRCEEFGVRSCDQANYELWSLDKRVPRAATKTAFKRFWLSGEFGGWGATECERPQNKGLLAAANDALKSAWAL